MLGHPSKAIKESLSKPQTKPSECAQLTHRDTRAATNLSIPPLPGTLQSGKNPDFWNLLPQYAARCFRTPRDEKTNLRPPSKNCSPRCMFLYSVLQRSTRIPEQASPGRAFFSSTHMRVFSLHLTSVVCMIRKKWE